MEKATSGLERATIANENLKDFGHPKEPPQQ
jgi:hypothetical protein